MWSLYSMLKLQVKEEEFVCELVETNITEEIQATICEALPRLDWADQRDSLEIIKIMSLTAVH